MPVDAEEAGWPQPGPSSSASEFTCMSHLTSQVCNPHLLGVLSLQLSSLSGSTTSLLPPPFQELPPGPVPIAQAGFRAFFSGVCFENK